MIIVNHFDVAFAVDYVGLATAEDEEVFGDADQVTDLVVLRGEMF